MNRSSYESWKESEKMRLEEVATETVRHRLQTYEKPDIDPATERDLRAYVLAAGYQYNPFLVGVHGFNRINVN
jgi:trimethylamine:corrinoid methyltransferase-like protein